MLQALWLFFTDAATFSAWVARVRPVQYIRAAMILVAGGIATGITPFTSITVALGGASSPIAIFLGTLAAVLGAGDKTQTVLKSMSPVELNAAGVATVTPECQRKAEADVKVEAAKK